MKPLGIVILSVLVLILGALLLLVGLVLAAFSGIVATLDIARTIGNFPGIPIPIHSLIALGIVLAVIGGIIVVVGIITLLVGWGLWTGRNWARWIAIIVFGLGALSNLVDILQGQFGSIVGLIINGLIVYYLFTPHVKNFFKAVV